MQKPVLVILAAGMGSRYGGLKQIDPIDEYGNKIIDYSIYDGIRAGFRKVIFIITKEMEKEFKECIGNIINKNVEVDYAFQEINKIPTEFAIPRGRVKPWGTAHAILCCKDKVEGPFAVINADDYYGKNSFKEIYDFLETSQDDKKFRYAMVCYKLGNTLTDNGSVARGCCIRNDSGYLETITERTQIEKRDNCAAYTQDSGKTYTEISLDTPVSMNMWGFSASIFVELEKLMKKFFETDIKSNPLKAEYFIPFAVDALLKADKATVKMLHSEDKWFGMTYKEDKPFVVEAIKKLKEQGIYPETLWD